MNHSARSFAGHRDVERASSNRARIKWRAGAASTLLLLGLACGPDESVARYAGVGSTWRLEGGGLEVKFLERGQITGRTDCGPVSGQQSAPYPWLSINLEAPDPGCAEVTDKLQSMRFAEVSGQLLVLSDKDGHDMVFTRQP